MREDWFWNTCNQILRERKLAAAKFGVQNWPLTDDIPGDPEAISRCTLKEVMAKSDVDQTAREGRCTWDRILDEELKEAYTCWATGDTEELRKELLQAAGVLFAIIDCLDRDGR